VQVGRVVETALYVDDMERAVAFYREALGMRPMGIGGRLTAMDAGAGTVLLLFRRGATNEGLAFPGGWIPPHDGSGPLHVAFAIGAAELETWEARLTDLGIAVESRVQWERGGHSLYLRDPDGHSVELVTPGTWETY
jgi:catechol 2,3-dioxygenase-like lactoylglutathione lyase family enzyme